MSIVCEVWNYGNEVGCWDIFSGMMRYGDVDRYNVCNASANEEKENRHVGHDVGRKYKGGKL